MPFTVVKTAMWNQVCAMQFRFDEEANALYIALHPGRSRARSR
jgi:hypothetical protein